MSISFTEVLNYEKITIASKQIRILVMLKLCQKGLAGREIQDIVLGTLVQWFRFLMECNKLQILYYYEASP